MSQEHLMDILESLDKRVEGLVAKVTQYKTERDRLKNELDDVKKEHETLAKAKEELAAQLSEGGEIRSKLKERVQAILEKIDRLE